MCLTVPDEVALEIWNWPGLEDSLMILGTRIRNTQYSQRSVYVELSTTHLPIPFSQLQCHFLSSNSGIRQISLRLLRPHVSQLKTSIPKTL